MDVKRSPISLVKCIRPSSANGGSSRLREMVAALEKVRTKTRQRAKKAEQLTYSARDEIGAVMSMKQDDPHGKP